MKRLVTSVWRVFARVVAITFAGLFILTAPLSLILVTLERQLFEPTTFKRALDETGIYERLPDLFVAQTVHSMEFDPCQAQPERCFGEGPADPEEPQPGGPPAYLDSLTPEVWGAIVTHLIPEAWIQTQAEGAIDQFFESLESDEPAPVVEISLVELKQVLMGGGMQAVFRQILDAQPACTPQQLQEMPSAVSRDDLDVWLECRPPEATIVRMMPQVERALGEVVADIPDVANPPLTALGGDGGGHRAVRGDAGPFAGRSPIQILHSIRQVLQLSLLVPALSLLGVTVFGVRSWKGLCSWWGWPFLVAGMMGLIPALGTGALLERELPALLERGGGGGFAPELRQAGMALVAHFVRSEQLWLGAASGALALIGLGLLIAASRQRTRGRTPGLAEEPSARA
jgi:hypothetical protein